MLEKKRTKKAFNIYRLCFVCLTAWGVGVVLAIILYYLIPIQAIHTMQIKSVAPFSNNADLAQSNSLHRVAKLFVHNISVGFLIGIGGFMTAGSLSIIILAYNGFIASSTIINAVLAHKNGAYLINHLLWHGVFEMSALIWLGAVGLSGFYAWKQFIQSRPVILNDYFSIKKIFLPVVLLVIAAIIEGR